MAKTNYSFEKRQKELAKKKKKEEKTQRRQEKKDIPGEEGDNQTLPAEPANRPDGTPGSPESLPE